MGDEVLTCGNCGGTYFFEVKRWRPNASAPVSFGPDDRPTIACVNCHALFVIKPEGIEPSTRR